MPRVRGQSLDDRADRAGLLYAARNLPTDIDAAGEDGPGDW